jgi:hypothetical protein
MPPASICFLYLIALNATLDVKMVLTTIVAKAVQLR